MIASARAGELDLAHPKEWKLAKALLRWPEVVLRALADFLPHNMCDYLYDLSTTFTEFYDACYVVEKDRQTSKYVFIHLLTIY